MNDKMSLAKGNLYIFCSFLHVPFAFYLILGSNAGINLGLDSSHGGRIKKLVLPMDILCSCFTVPFLSFSLHKNGFLLIDVSNYNYLVFLGNWGQKCLFCTVQNQKVVLSFHIRWLNGWFANYIVHTIVWYFKVAETKKCLLCI